MQIEPRVHSIKLRSPKPVQVFLLPPPNLPIQENMLYGYIFLSCSLEEKEEKSWLSPIFLQLSFLLLKSYDSDLFFYFVKEDKKSFCTNIFSKPCSLSRKIKNQSLKVMNSFRTSGLFQLSYFFHREEIIYGTDTNKRHKFVCLLLINLGANEIQ